MRVTSKLLAVACLSFRAQAQNSPAALAQTVVDRWSAGAEKGFAAVYPFRQGRDALATSLGAKARLAGLANVIRADEGKAILLISGVPVLPNSGDATLAGAGLSGVYEARVENGVWKLQSRVPLEDMGRILVHEMKVAVRPAFGLTVEDRMRIRVKGRDGFAVRLNHAAKIQNVGIAGKAVPYLFGGGLFWAALPDGEAELTVRYSVAVEGDSPATNSGCFLEQAGHVRNQYFWHPFSGFDETRDWSDFHIEVRIPEAYRLSTGIPQTERVSGGQRMIEGRTVQPGIALTLVYDRDWKVETRHFGDTRVEFFVTPDIQPNQAAIFDEFQSVYRLLSERFGDLRGGYHAVVQARSWKDNPGWRFASNQAVVSAMNPGVMTMKSPVPHAPLAHEIAHFWTAGATGPARNFLSEGWAVWAESAILENQFGAETASEFWEQQKSLYFLAFDGKASLLEDENNSGVSYVKGPWIFQMLQDALGSGGFRKTIAEYSRRSLERPGGWELLAECAQHNAPPDFNAREFLLPWLTEKRAPAVTARIDGSSVRIHQDAPVFQLPLVLEAATARGPERRRIWIKGADTVVAFPTPVSDVKLDPDGALLLRQ